MAKSKIILFLIVVPILLLGLLNLFTVFTPEIGFDALWYHLTLPKLYLMQHRWYFPGGLLYYSAMPRLAETFFIPLVQFTGTIGPKMVQYLAGIGTGVVLWKILADFKQTTLWKWLGVALFYCTWLVSWQSGSAYVDLIRTFLEALALLFLLRGFWKLGGVFLGLAIGTKWLSLGSLAIYAFVFGPQIIFPALLVSAPWFALAFFFTGNPLYPIFSGVISNSFLGFWSMLKQVVLSPYFLTRPFDDFLSPLAGFFLIFSLLSLKSQNIAIRRVSIIGVLGSLYSLVLDPPSSRFVLPFLPALVIPTVLFVSASKKVWLKNSLIAVAIISGFFILGLRLLAFQKYIPYLLGQEDRVTFLVSQSSRLPGTFIDSDGFVASLPVGSKILVDRLHNLYYFPRNFDHTSWVTDRTGYDYLVTIGEIPSSVTGELIHTNSLGIQTFKLK